MPRTHQRPEYLQNDPLYLIRLPFVATSGDPNCPHEYNNGAHAAIHSILAALKSDEIADVRIWLAEASRQLEEAVKSAAKPSAEVPTEGAEYPLLFNSEG